MRRPGSVGGVPDGAGVGPVECSVHAQGSDQAAGPLASSLSFRAESRRLCVASAPSTISPARSRTALALPCGPTRCMQCVLTEQAVRRPVVSPLPPAEQMNRPASLSCLPNVQIGVIPPRVPEGVRRVRGIPRSRAEKGHPPPAGAALLGGLRSVTQQPPSEQHRAPPDGQQSTSEDATPHVGQRQDHSPERGASCDTGVIGIGVRRECDIRAARCATQHLWVVMNTGPSAPPISTRNITAATGSVPVAYRPSMPAACVATAPVSAACGERSSR